MPGSMLVNAYKIVNDVDNEVFVGTTTNTLSARMSKIRWDYSQGKNENRKIFLHFDKYGLANFHIVLLGSKRCRNTDEQIRFERDWFDKLQPTLNAFVHPGSQESLKRCPATPCPARSKRYRLMYKEQIREQHRRYRSEHLEEARAYSRKYNAEHPEVLLKSKLNFNKKRKEYEEGVKQAKTYYCNVCDKAYAYRCYLRNHLKSKSHLSQ